MQIFRNSVESLNSLVYSAPPCSLLPFSLECDDMYQCVGCGSIVKRVFHSFCDILLKIHFENIVTKWWYLHSYFFVSPIYLVGVPCALLGPIVCWCRPSNCLPSAAGPSRSPNPTFGTVCRTMWSLPSLCRPSVSVWKHFCSRPRSMTLSSISVKLFPYL